MTRSLGLRSKSEKVHDETPDYYHFTVLYIRGPYKKDEFVVHTTDYKVRVLKQLLLMLNQTVEIRVGYIPLV